MNIQDIINAATSEGMPSDFIRGLETVLPDECEFESDGITIRKERPDECGWTFAGLNQKDDELPVVGKDNVIATAQWIASQYLYFYWTPCHCDSLPSPLSILVFVQAVNQGNGEAIKLLQTALNDYGANLTIDGQIGDLTTKAAKNAIDANGLCFDFLKKSSDYYKAIVASNPSKEPNLKGWLNRIAGLEFEFCKDQLVTSPSPPQSPIGSDGLIITSDILNI